MDVLELLGSVNKVSIFFFILTLGVLGYEFYLFQKEKKKKEKPKIPTFNPSRVVQAHNYTPAPSSENEKPKTLKKHKNLAVMIAVTLIAFLGVILFVTIQSTQTPEEVPPPIRTRADVNVTEGPSPEITQEALFVTPTPTDVVLAENVTPTVTGVPIESITPTTPPVGGPETTTGTPTVTLISTSASATLTPTKAAVASVSSPTPTTPQTLPVAATVQPHLFILLLGALTVFFSILY